MTSDDLQDIARFVFGLNKLTKETGVTIEARQDGYMVLEHKGHGTGLNLQRDDENGWTAVSWG